MRRKVASRPYSNGGASVSLNSRARAEAESGTSAVLVCDSLSSRRASFRSRQSFATLFIVLSHYFRFLCDMGAFVLP